MRVRANPNGPATTGELPDWFASGKLSTAGEPSTCSPAVVSSSIATARTGRARSHPFSSHTRPRSILHSPSPPPPSSSPRRPPPKPELAGVASPPCSLTAVCSTWEILSYPPPLPPTPHASTSSPHDAGAGSAARQIVHSLLARFLPLARRRIKTAQAQVIPSPPVPHFPFPVRLA